MDKRLKTHSSKVVVKSLAAMLAACEIFSSRVCSVDALVATNLVELVILLLTTRGPLFAVKRVKQLRAAYMR